MTDAQFVAIQLELQGIAKDMKTVAANSASPGKAGWWSEMVGVAAAIGCIAAYLVQFFQWLWR
jgi:hypothetical protein